MAGAEQGEIWGIQWWLKYSVKMSFGNWRERTSEACEDDPEVLTGIMIKDQVQSTGWRKLWNLEEQSDI